MENTDDFQKEQISTPELCKEQPEPGTEEPRYGTIANRDTRWVYGDQEHQGGNPQTYVAEQRRLEEEKRAREIAEAEKAVQSKKTTSGGSAGFFSGSEFQAERQPRRSRSINRFHNTSAPTPPNSNFGLADMSGQPQYLGTGPQYNGGKLPSRKGPITMFVIGLLIFIISPLVFVGGIFLMFAGVNTQQVVDETNLQAQVEKDTFTVIVVKQAELNNPVTCEATQNGTKLADLVGNAERESSHDKVFVYKSIGGGKMNLKCATADGKAPMEMSLIVNLSFMSFMVVFVLSSILGILGLVFVIWGIIWWVRRNRARRMIMMGF